MIWITNLCPVPIKLSLVCEISAPVMFSSAFYVPVLLLFSSASRAQNGVCKEGEPCKKGEERKPQPPQPPPFSSPCAPTHIPWLCRIGHACCSRRISQKGYSNTKRKCRSTPRCEARGGRCVSVRNNDCATAEAFKLCNGALCTCCIGDHQACTPLPRCRFKGGYCFRGNSKVLCPSKKVLGKGCTGNRCSCCVSDRRCQCGRATTSNRIVGGNIVRPQNKYPWMVGIQVPSFVNETYVCGGSIINDLYVITAAHCLYDLNGRIRKPKQLLVGLADHKQFSTEDDIEGVTSLVRVKKVIVHEEYGEGPNNDIGLLRLKKPLDLVSHRQVKPVCLPTRYTKTYEGDMGAIYGWGTTSDSTPIENVLRETTVPIVDASCKNKTIGSVKITPQMMCAGYFEGGKDSCLGDSGGPLTVQEYNRHILVGITSFGEGCGLKDTPGVYARVTAFLDWIIRNTRDASFCN